MRHADIVTTMGYCVQIGADELAADPWANYTLSGNTSRDIDPENRVFSEENG